MSLIARQSHPQYMYQVFGWLYRCGYAPFLCVALDIYFSLVCRNGKKRKLTVLLVMMSLRPGTRDILSCDASALHRVCNFKFTQLLQALAVTLHTI